MGTFCHSYLFGNFELRFSEQQNQEFGKKFPMRNDIHLELNLCTSYLCPVFAIYNDHLTRIILFY